MRAQELYNFCAVNQHKSRLEAEKMKNSTDVEAWEMWYERSIGEATAFFTMAHFILKEAEKHGEKVDKEEYLRLL
ncbi:hypothetical protein GC101_21980 [Paenibacillus sp. LMG 31459]|uniref:Uncharacterized protein n=1 Tax=Paenibacillus phytohabitans TaxID=2654978 RepID=A0ABX1YKG3_9BACL|nr:hypothetical protein [Paenibacillus phytohabitans]NOU81535.1 hypothetical protein [Paenibacillus phytohabitans]